MDAGPAAASAPGEVRALEIDGLHVALADVDGRWYAFADECSHHDCPLASGDLVGPTIECDCHGSRFDVRTGEVVRGPADEAIPVYAVTVDGDRLLVQVRTRP